MTQGVIACLATAAILSGACSRGHPVRAPEPAASSEVLELIGEASFPGDAHDLSGLTGLLEDGTPRDRLGGHGSAIAWTGVGNRYVMVADRGPGDGATTFETRFHECEIVCRPGATPALTVAVRKTTLFKDERGRPLPGNASAIGSGSEAGRRFDPEGARVGPAGSLYVSDEYGPAVAEFGMDGVRRRLFPVPKSFSPRTPRADAKQELAGNHEGRVPNKGFEGLALSPDGRTLYALTQAALIQDHGHEGRNCRMLAIDIASGATRQFVVPLSEPSHDFTELLAIGESSFLAIERDGRAGARAHEKKIVRLDLLSGTERASDVSSIDSLPSDRLPEGVIPVRKSLFLDLLDPRFGLAGDTFPAKVEGLALGPDLPDGRALLLVTSDNDFIASNPTWVWAFAVSRPLLSSSAAK